MGPSSPGVARPPLDEQNELLSDNSGGASSISSPRDTDWPSPRVCGFALNHDDFYDPDPLTSRPSPIRVLYGDNSSLSYIVAARPVTPLSHRSSKLSVRYFQDDAF